MQYLSGPTSAPYVRYSSLLAAMRSQSPPTLPYAPEVDCDPVEISQILNVPVTTQVVTARGRGVIATTDHHS